MGNWTGLIYILVGGSVLGLACIPVSAQVTPDGLGTQVTTTGNQIEIQGGTRSRNGDNLFHSFDRFNLNSAQTANFQVEAATRNVFARIRGGEASIIDGLLKLSGGSANLYLMNPAGMFFGPNARLNLPAMFSATTATGIGFEQGRWEIQSNGSPDQFTSAPTSFSFALSQPGAIVNTGHLAVQSGQALNLSAGTIVNTGTLQAPGGQITLTAVPGGQQVRLSQTGSVLGLELSTQQPIAQWTPETIGQLLTKTQNIHHATQLETTPDGKIHLKGSGTTISPNLTAGTVVPGTVVSGTVVASGTLDTASTGQGGRVEVLGDRVQVAQATVKADGQTGGGTILIGGEKQGQGRRINAITTEVDRHSVMTANAGQQGKGGQVIVWADRDTQFAGTIQAQGGQQQGDGGFVEVSGKQRLRMAGSVDVGAPQGNLGQVLLDPTDILISKTGSNTLPDANSPDSTWTISPDALSTITGNITLTADRSIWFQTNPNSSDNTVALGSGGQITFRAGTEFRSDVGLTSEGRSLLIQAPKIQLQTINTSLAQNRQGSVTLQGLPSDEIINSSSDSSSNALNSKKSVQVSFRNIITPGQDVTIDADRINGDLILTSATDKVLTTGKVRLTGTRNLSVSGVITQGQDVTLTSRLDQTSGQIQTGPVITFGGSVQMTANRIQAGLIWTTPNGTTSQFDRAGNITLQASTDLMARHLEANGQGPGRAGDIRLINPSGDIIVDSIQAYGGSGGGNVDLQGDTIRIVGARYESNANNSQGAPTYEPSSIKAGESLTITQRGGPTNQPFIVGDASLNGSNRKIVVAGQAIEGGSFAIQNQTVQYQPLKNFTLTAENQSPYFPNLDGADFLYKTVDPGSRSVFTLAELGFTNPVDPDRDQVQVYLRPVNPGGQGIGQLFDATGRLITSTTPIRLTDRLTYVAPSNGADSTRFEVLALDGTRTEASLATAPRVSLLLSAPLIPTVEPPVPETNSTKISLDMGTSLSNVSLEEASRVDNQLSQEFIAVFGGELPKFVDGAELVRQIEKQLKIRPALVYLRTQMNELELTLITARGRFRKRVVISRDRLLDLVKTFRREVTNPLKTHSTSYLASAQKLYEWIITPLKTDLEQQGITNIVFLPEAGLRALPYAALHDGQKFLIEQYSVGLMPSVGLTQTNYFDLRRSRVLAIGISEVTQGQTPLPMVKTELATIAQLWNKQTTYLNQEATLNNLKTARQKQDFQIVHVATHANFTADSPKDAYIQLWNDRLKLEQIRQLDWNNPAVELLVLSACRTALGNRDAELGLAGLSLQTGVKTAVASLWYVNDTATMSLISQFYQSMRTSPVKAEALRQAQIAMARGTLRFKEGKITGLSSAQDIDIPNAQTVSDSSFKHPYYWAAFTMIGNPW
ncbi:CHAT domain-containing protein [Alkalinema sp. FACHB-956]|uniref:CHAT domain-containing protein n=1 Tax=Alkalinema sp. FACHB-956 TaxID=2692768 RepID=UPI001683E28C|nr:CHAT domain-containing protein [Alkalinema sp. FACHB-956]MBD2326189.1 CHAT domain-containing protein [Alkalinema sp. FACHB-956]